MVAFAQTMRVTMTFFLATRSDPLRDSGAITGPNAE